MQVYNQKDDDTHQRQTSRLDKLISVNPKVILLLLVLLIAIPVTVFLSLERIETHRRWGWQEIASQRFMFHLRHAANVLDSSGFEKNETARAWFSAEISYAGSALSDLGALDTRHRSQLFSVREIVWSLDSGFCFVGLNETQRSILIGLIRGLADKVVVAYWNYLNYTQSDIGSGPPFWYFGPAPPDETVLREAIDLANQIGLQVS